MEAVHEIPQLSGASCCTQTRLKNALFGEKALILIALTLAITAAFSPTQAMKSVRFTGETMLFLSPYFVFAFALGAYMKAASFELMVTKIFGGRAVPVIAMASLFGAISPLCSCTVIPLVAVLLRAKVPLYAIMAFWISSPIMSPDMYVLTAGILGFQFANAKLLAAVFMGVASGFATLPLERMGLLQTPLKGELNQGDAAVGLGASLSPVWKFWQEPARKTVFWEELKRTAPLILKWLTLAFILESLMVAYVPTDFVASTVGVSSIWAIPLAVAIGIPAYLNGLAAVPFINGLMLSGMAPGAALAFLVGGSVTSIPAMMAVSALVKPKIFALYLALGVVTAMIVGYAYQGFVNLVGG